MMRLTLVLLGLLLMAFGLVICFGTMIGRIERMSDYSLATDVVGVIFMGVAPFVLGAGLLVTGIVLQLRGRKAQKSRGGAA